MGYGLEDRVSISVKSKKCFFSSIASRPALGPTQPPIQWEPGALSPTAKQLGRKPDHTSPSCAEVKNDEAIPPRPIYLHSVDFHYVTKYRDNFIFFTFTFLEYFSSEVNLMSFAMK
jgi:hypothetical protein